MGVPGPGSSEQPQRISADRAANPGPKKVSVTDEADEVIIDEADESEEGDDADLT